MSKKEVRLALHGIKIAIGSLGASILLSALPMFVEDLKSEFKLITSLVPFILLIMGIYVIYLAIKIKVK